MTVYTYGVFDLLHTGHVELLKQAKALGHTLIVGVFTDEVAKSYKRAPIIPQDQRYALISALKVVDKVVYQDEFSPQRNLDLLRPDIVCKADGAGWDEQNIPKFEGVKSILLGYTNGVSTSAIIERIKNG